MSEQREDHDAIVERIVAVLRNPGGLIEQFEGKLEALADEVSSAKAVASDSEAKTEYRLSKIEERLAQLAGD
ncbi:hypothetical protein [Salinicola sp. CR57]|uniref:hypothetical protein n=1 Tax=Salinicola sp. CR57 TaxID=1949086 RepID=UPI000DA2231B|nr:hypothetical protein [Salinicola sp. CR57]